METVGEFIPDRAPSWAGQAMASQLPGRVAVAGAADGVGTLYSMQNDVAGGMAIDDAADAADAVDAALTLLRSWSPAARADVALFGLREAADFAGRVEELSRTVEYFQMIGAAAVDRTRKESAAAPPAAGWGADAATPATWLTGWTQDADAGSAAGPSGTGPAAGPSVPAAVPAAVSGAVPVAADDGYRNAAEFLQARLRISAPEARRRLALAGELLPRTNCGGHTGPPAREELAASVASGEVASHAATIITTAMNRVRHLCPPETAAAMEHALTRTAIENDPDFLARIARRWVEALDQDGAEPSEDVLRRLQGAFIRKPRHGLHHLEIFATADQFEHLVTVMNTATNPRTGTAAGTGQDTAADAAGQSAAVGNAVESVAVSIGTGQNTEAGGAGKSAAAGNAVETAVSIGTDPAGAGAADALDRRSRPQRLLDGLVGGCKAALAAGGLPATGGFRPQIMATIDYRDLLQRLGGTGIPGEVAGGVPGGAESLNQGSGSLMFTGPITASTVRKLACDADIIPVVFGGEGQVLDIGRASRVFPPHIRKALVARDVGCAFPQCTIPALWCEAHHIDYWSRGGKTGTSNGTLLCSHHHHLIHKEQWSIRMRAGIPWFVPPPHIDPAQAPRRNRHFRLE
ncbi:HNH endonuclease signature motif containing protein [Arthrobacter oryzae]|uniref:Uncharacterized protein DUF222 n=1 Tax=Arthrobacter oryzae TaxID=409290 RepID=A0A495ETI0_9MICC|nr:HNH endonuclease signature motif containing protein [Arthrobacter oryzae]RKR19646.1 uncharacterized protein DUF222 [Arthrobacter oryzae]